MTDSPLSNEPDSVLNPHSMPPHSQATGQVSLGSQWLDGYAPLEGALDEMMEAGGAIRPAWQHVMELWGAQSQAKFQANRQAANRYLRDNGVAHRVYGGEDSSERPWPLSHMPLVLDPKEWQEIEEGLIQRAELLERVVADLYGHQSLVTQGHLPAHLVAGAPGFLRPLVGVTPKHNHHLHYIAVELGRGPDGRWWVLGDRTQAPSGAGYAVENRLATSRAFGREANALSVQRLAGFFQSFRQALGRMTDQDSARVGLLTPGPFNESYYEQAFLARYLGFLLLEGGDLIMRDGALFVRTVRGLKKLDVLWRRVDALYSDPLELKADSRLGVPGLVSAVRSGGLTCVNALSAGLLESRFFMAFLPRLAESMLGEPLKLPNIATWWLGDPAAQTHLQQSPSQTVRLSAYGTSLPMDARHQAAMAHSNSADLEPHDHVAQEIVRLSTMPTLGQEPSDAQIRLRPKPFILRVFVARTLAGWQVMPGGFCRVSETDDTRALSMQDGSLSADVWVPSTQPLNTVSLLPKPGTQPIRRVPGTLPARAADNLFWLGRYTERAQLSIRLVRAYLARRLDGLGTDDPLVLALEDQLEAWGIEDPSSPDVFEQALLPNLIQARDAASVIRDRFSPDAWQSLNHFVIGAQAGHLAHLSPVEKMNNALVMLAAFAGLVGENMIRLSGWRFLEIGRRLERAIGTCQLTSLFGSQNQQAGALDLLLEIADSVMSYSQRYTVTTDRLTVVDLIVLDPNNPRSVAFQLDRIHVHINEITDHKAFDQPSTLQRMAFGVWSDMHTMQAKDLTQSKLDSVTTQLFTLSEAVSGSFLQPAQPNGTIGL